MSFKPDPKFKTEAKQTFNQMRLKAFRTKQKYHNVRTEYNGLKYDSKLEAKVAQDLDWQIKSGDILEWKRQVKIPLKANGVFIANYYIDFIYLQKDGTKVYLEVKGMETELWKIKWKLLQAIINEIDPGSEMIVLKS